MLVSQVTVTIRESLARGCRHSLKCPFISSADHALNSYTPNNHRVVNVTQKRAKSQTSLGLLSKAGNTVAVLPCHYYLRS